MRAPRYRPGDKPWSRRERKESVRRAPERSLSESSTADIRIRSGRPVVSRGCGRRCLGSDCVDHDDIANLQVVAGNLDQSSIVQTGAHPYRNQLVITKQPNLCAAGRCARSAAARTTSRCTSRPTALFAGCALILAGATAGAAFAALTAAFSALTAAFSGLTAAFSGLTVFS